MMGADTKSDSQTEKRGNVNTRWKEEKKKRTKERVDGRTGWVIRTGEVGSKQGSGEETRWTWIGANYWELFEQARAEWSTETIRNNELVKTKSLQVHEQDRSEQMEIWNRFKTASVRITRTSDWSRMDDGRLTERNQKTKKKIKQKSEKIKAPLQSKQLA